MEEKQAVAVMEAMKAAEQRVEVAQAESLVVEALAVEMMAVSLEGWMAAVVLVVAMEVAAKAQAPRRSVLWRRLQVC